MLGKVSECKALLHDRMVKLAKAERGPDATIAEWRFHDFRRNARSYFSQVTSPDIAEKCLGHIVGGVRAVYDLYGYRSEKAAALAAWAVEIERIVAQQSADTL